MELLCGASLKLHLGLLSNMMKALVDKKVSLPVETRVRIKSDETSFFGAEKRNQTFENFRAITF